MLAAYYPTAHQVDLHELPVPEPGTGEVQVRVRACGICGSDLHRFRAGGHGSSFTPGHEIAGEVAALGAGVSGWEIGQPVVVEPLQVCGNCAACRRGDYQICPDRLLLGAGRPGGLAEYVNAPAYALFAAPPSLPWPLTALAEPVAVAVHGVRIVDVAREERVLVQGSGTIGLLCILAAAESGAQVWATARYPHQAEAAERFGAARIFPATADGERELAGYARTAPFDVVIETVGGEADTLVRAPALTKQAGRISVLGIFFDPPRLDALALVLREIRMVGAITYGRRDGVADFDIALRLIAEHRATMESLLTHQRPLSAIREAFAIADDKASKALKVTVEPAS